MSEKQSDTSRRDVESYRASFMTLQPKTAISAMQFDRLRARAESQMEVNQSVEIVEKVVLSWVRSQG
jgi:hypothetical protein